MTEVVIDTGGNEMDTATLQGMLTLSADAPKGLAAVEYEAPRLVLSYTEDPSERIGELLRVVGGCAKGDDPITVIEGPGKGEEVQPEGRPGATRWNCPRCTSTVIEGRNNVPGIVGEGICAKCYAVDTGGAPPAARPAVSTGAPPQAAPAPAQRPAVAIPPTLDVQPSATPDGAPAAEAAAVPAQVPAVLAAARIPIFASATDLPDPLAVGPGILVYVMDSRALMLSTQQGWGSIAWNIAPIG
jgi:hypothetical protein